MKKTIILALLFLVSTSCGSGKSFQSFFNDYKNDVGVTAFQVPNFMRALLRNISPEMNGLFKNVSDFKFIKFNQISAEKKAALINDINLVTANNYTDVLRSNTTEKTKVISVRENGDVVTHAIIFNSTLNKTSAFYLKGKFDPNRIKELSETNQFENLSNKLIQNYQTPNFTPSFNPNN